MQKLDFRITVDAELMVLEGMPTYFMKQNEEQKEEFRKLETKWKKLEKKSTKDKQGLLFLLDQDTSEREKEAESVHFTFYVSELKGLVQEHG